MNSLPNLIAVDFDGTCVMHEYPCRGRDCPGAVETLKDLVAEGAQLILWTMRSGDALADAVKWFVERGIPLYGINRNPSQTSWTSSPKAYAKLYIDDAALGCPLVYPTGVNQRPYVNWKAVRELLNLD